MASLLVGFLWARRITKPIYELEVQVESAAERTRIHLAPGRAGLETLGDQVSAIVEKLEETDAALFEHRRRLVQSEKLSAVGELAAKLAHEVLNPLAGMKAATQLLERQGAAAPGGGPVVETARALDREITRVEGLVRRLMNYARPLAPRFELCHRRQPGRRGAGGRRPGAGPPPRRRSRGARSPNLPPLEVDPQLVTQALVNLIVNAAEATPAGGGAIEVEAARATSLGRDEIAVRVARPRRRHPAPSASASCSSRSSPPSPRGTASAWRSARTSCSSTAAASSPRNRPDAPGAVFELQIPVVR